MENNIIQFEVMLNIALILMVMLLATYVAIQGQKLKSRELQLEKMRAAARRHKEAQAEKFVYDAPDFGRQNIAA